MKFKTIGISLIWLLLAGGLFYFFDSKVHPNTADKLSGSAEVTLQRDLSGHYRADAFINGTKTPALIDTGATDVAISQRLADRLGINSTHAIRTQTANGATVAYMTRLDSVKLGGIEETDVAAIITPNLEGDMLLGMSFLNRMDVRLYKGTMTIRAIND
ncbi:MAG: peptidase A2 [Gallionellales bacterium GWA2_60_142]|nr:MAG: peptidase A2 [Gallionellales bacterium GWA2_60_142]HCI15140.1 TIGR02281 family clan AA aspartic protease [Gallionellaceae bacterium]